MKLKSLNCPQCGSALEVEDGIDTFYCKYCGAKIMMDGLSDEAYKSRVKIRFIDRFFDGETQYAIIGIAALGIGLIVVVMMWFAVFKLMAK